MDKQAVLYSVNGILFSAKNKWTINLWKDIEEP